MVLLAVLGISLSFGIPKITGILDNNRFVAQSNALIGYLSYARSEAVKRGTNVSVSSTSGTTDWVDGWQIAIDATAEVLRISDPPNLNDTTIIGPITITFAANGSSSPPSTIVICRGSQANQARAINISAIGTIQSARDTESDGIVNDILNINVVCP